MLPVAGFGPLMLWSVGGLETALFVALVGASVAAALRERDQSAGGRRVPLSALLLLLATLTRDDAPAYAPLLVLIAFDPLTPGRVVRWAFAFGLGVVVLWGAHGLYYGAWQPNPFLSKVAGIEGRLALGRQYFADFAWLAWPLLAAAGAGAFLQMTAPDTRRRRDGFLLSVGLILALAYPIWTGGDWMPLFRLYAPVAVFAAPLVVWGGAALAERAASLKLPAQALVAVVCAVIAWSTFAAGRTWTTRLYVLKTGNDFFLRVGELAKGSPQDVRYALSDIGGFGWASDAYVVDTGGLVARRIALLPHGADGPRPLRVLEKERPEVLFVFVYAGNDEGFKRQLYSAMLDLSRGGVTSERARALLLHLRARPNVDAARFIEGSPEYRLVNIAISPALPQYYLVFVREDALARVPVAVLATRLNEGIAEYEVGNRQVGLDLLQRQMESNPFDEIGFAEQAARWSEGGHPERAIENIARAIALNPRNARYPFRLGNLYAQIGRTGDAVREFGAAVSLDRSWADAQNNLGFYLAVLGRFDEAAGPLSEAVRLNPGHTLARNNLAWVESERRPAVGGTRPVRRSTGSAPPLE